MQKLPKIIVISSPDFFQGEADVINQLFEAGLEKLHLRKPDSTVEDYAELINQISSANHNKIVLHNHYQLIDSFRIGGMHFRDKYLTDIDLEDFVNLSRFCKAHGKSISRSVHSIADARASVKTFDYVLLSPIFNSISKPGYNANFSTQELTAFLSDASLKNKITALGGINKNTLNQAVEIGFASMAVLGAVWENQAKALQEFKTLQTHE